MAGRLFVLMPVYGCDLTCSIVGIFFGLVGIAYLKASTLDSLAILTSLFLAIYEINLVR